MSQISLFTQPTRSRPTSRKAIFGAIVLALLTGLVAGQLAAPSPHDFGLPALVPSAKTALLAADYYDAVNHVLKGESSSRLASMIRPEYIGHPAESEVDENLAALLARLDELKRIFPHIQLNAELISADSQLVVVRVSVVGTSDGELAGILVETTAAPPEIEVLRFDGDALAERWSHVHWPATFALHGAVQHTTAMASPLQPRLERITLEPHGQLELAYETAYLIATETGELEIQGQERPGSSVAERRADVSVDIVGSEPVTLHEGELALAAKYGPYTIRTLGSEVATFLLFRIEDNVRESQFLTMPSQVAPKESSIPDRLALATALEIESKQQPWIISFSQVTLASGSMLASHQVEGVEIVVVESGVLRALVGACTTRCIETTEEKSQFASEDVLLQASEGFSVAQGAAVAYDSGPAGPATFLMITIARPSADRASS